MNYTKEEEERAFLIDIYGYIGKPFHIYCQYPADLNILKIFDATHIFRVISSKCLAANYRDRPLEINYDDSVAVNLEVSFFKDVLIKENPFGEGPFLVYSLSQAHYEEIFTPYHRILENDGKLISLSNLNPEIRQHLISMEDVPFDKYNTYGDLELMTESRTHYEMRIYAMEFFLEHNYKIIPRGVGIKHKFTFSDFLAVRNNRLIFVECLTDTSLSKETIEKKNQLLEFGEICYVIIGGATIVTQKNLKKVIFFNLNCDKIHLLFYLYGEYSYKKTIRPHTDEKRFYSDFKDAYILNYSFEKKKKFETIIVTTNEHFDQKLKLKVLSTISDFIIFYLRKAGYAYSGSLSLTKYTSEKPIYKIENKKINPITFLIKNAELHIKYVIGEREFILQGLRENFNAMGYEMKYKTEQK